MSFEQTNTNNYFTEGYCVQSCNNFHNKRARNDISIFYALIQAPEYQKEIIY